MALSEGHDLTVAIATMSDRLPHLALPPARSGISYQLFVQGQIDEPVTALPAALQKREDLELVQIPGRGLSKSRNAALNHCKDPYLVFADDDMELYPEGLLEVCEMFKNDPGLDLIAGWRKESLAITSRKRRMRHRLTVWNSGRICAPELAVRLSTFQTRGVAFDPTFGLGAEHGIGEEYVFVTDALKSGCHGVSVPVVLGSHPGPSTGDDWKDPDLMRARHAMLCRVFGVFRIFIRPAYAWRHRRRFASALAVCQFAMGIRAK